MYIENDNINFSCYRQKDETVISRNDEPVPDETVQCRDQLTKKESYYGWSINAYDFSLTSGTHEFDSDIRITIPRGDDGSTGCVWYNAETGRWEDIYSEVSEDNI